MVNTSAIRAAAKGEGNVIIREAAKFIKKVKVRKPRKPRVTRYADDAHWTGPRVDGKPRTYMDDNGMVHVAPGDTRPHLDPRNRPKISDETVNTTWDNAKGPDGKVRDPNTDDVIDWKPGDPRKGVWDMGHTPGNEYRREWHDYLDRRPPYDGPNAAELFKKNYDSPGNYQPELPGANRSHRYEAP